MISNRMIHMEIPIEVPFPMWTLRAMSFKSMGVWILTGVACNVLKLLIKMVNQS